MKALAAALLLGVACAFVSESTYQESFVGWMQKFDKSYSPEEFFYRYNTFKSNFDFVEKHNAGNYTWSVELNKFADLSSGEFKTTYLGYKPELRRGDRQVTLRDLKVGAYPDGSIDWVAKGAVTGVKDQGQCGSCWSFSTTGAVEGIVQIKHGQLTPLSEQELMDCSYSYGNLACNGGLMDNAFKYVMANGLCTEAAYPYTAQSSKTCRASSCTASPNSKISGYTDVKATETFLGQAVDLQPISIAIEADQSGFQMYKSGVFCGVCGTNLDHGVLAVGYGTDSGSDYWKVKNSWGTSWGEAGYIRMCRNKNECGIASEPSYPTE
jgi:C1A family cysteine protease